MVAYTVVYYLDRGLYSIHDDQVYSKHGSYKHAVGCDRTI